MRKLTPLKLAPAVALVATLLGTPAATPAASAASTASVRVTTWNFEVRRSAAELRAGVVKLTERSDLIGLQEINSPEKEEVLRSLSGWEVYRERPALQTPVLWRSDRFTYRSGRAVKISSARSIGDECPTMRSWQKARYVTVVRLVDRVSGRKISVISAHLISGATRNGQPWPGRPRLYRLWAQGLDRLAEISAAEKRWGTVFTMGDFNAGWVADNKFRLWRFPIRTYKRIGMRASWATEVPTNGIGTRNDKLIDQMYSQLRATSSKVQGDINYSDHRPAIGTYVLTAAA